MNFPLSVSPSKEMAVENQSNPRSPDLMTGEPGCSVGRATEDQIRKWWVRFPLRSEIFSLPRAISHLLAKPNVQWEIHTRFTLTL